LESSMGRFIGEDLNDREVATLQAVAFNAGGAQFGSVAGLRETIDTHRDCRAIEEATDEEIEVMLNKLAGEYLIQRKDIKGKPHVGLTEDGERCNLISVY
jgi:hypothetical protein